MAVKILIKRKVPREKGGELLNLITELRSQASVQPGYISGETLKSMDQPDEYLVISTWQSVDDGKAWVSSKERSQVESKVQAIVGEPTRYEIYHYPEKIHASLRAYIWMGRG